MSATCRARRIVGLSKLARVVERFARGLQVQERLTKQVADCLDHTWQPQGVGVVIEAEHQCMSLRGMRAHDSRTLTSALHGHLRSDAAARHEFFALTHRPHCRIKEHLVSAKTFIIVGAGLAGAKAAEALREQGFDGRLILLGAETHRPYERPALSKGYLTGATERDALFVHPEDWYGVHNVELRLGQPVSGIDQARTARRSGRRHDVGYDKLLVATGASPRTLDVPGADATGVHYLRTIDDSEALRRMFATATTWS